MTVKSGRELTGQSGSAYSFLVTVGTAFIVGSLSTSISWKFRLVSIRWMKATYDKVYPDIYKGSYAVWFRHVFMLVIFSAGM
jgi:hypothetical protein